MQDGERWEGRRVLVLGAAGFVGRWVARALARRGARLDLAVRDPRAAAPILERWGVQAPLHAADLAHPGAASLLVRDCAPELVMNLAGYGVDRRERDPGRARRLNAELPAELVDALAREGPGGVGVRLVHVGSALEYGEIAGDLAEDTEPRATTLYGRTKLEGTRAVAARAAATGVVALTARLFTVYGPGEHAGRLLPSLQAAACSDGPIALTAGTQQRDFTWVGDVAEGLLRLARADPSALGAGPAINLATGHLTSVRAFCQTAAQALGIPSRRLDFGALPTRAEEMQHDPVSLERLRGLVGWTPATSVAEGIRRALAWERG